MLNIVNNLKPFIEDCYKRINVREYARLLRVSPPTASKMLDEHEKEGILIKEKDRNYLFFHANNKNKVFIELSRIYWFIKLNNLLEYFEKELVNPTVILFGSLSKAESKIDSDIDIAIFASKKDLNIKQFEDKLKRKLQIFLFNSINEIPSKELTNSIINGYVLKGRISL